MPPVGPTRGRKTLDFSWLSALGSNEPTPNPAMGAEFDPMDAVNEYGGIDPEGGYTTKSGATPTATEIIKNGTGPVKQASFWQKLLNPQLASDISRINTDYKMLPVEEGQKFDIARGQAKQMIDAGYRYATGKSMSPEELDDAVGSFGLRTTQSGLPASEVAVSRKSIAQIKGGQPETEAETSIATAKGMLESAKRSLNRQPVTEATLDAQAANDLAKHTGLDPLVIRHAISQTRAALNREPTTEEVLDNAAALELKQQGINNERLDVTKEILPTERSTRIGAANLENLQTYNPGAGTTGSPRIGKLSPEGVLTSQRNPLYSNAYDKMQDIANPNATTTVPLSNGGAVRLPPTAQNPSIRALAPVGGQPTTSTNSPVSPVKGAKTASSTFISGPITGVPVAPASTATAGSSVPRSDQEITRFINDNDVNKLGSFEKPYIDKIHSDLTNRLNTIYKTPIYGNIYNPEESAITSNPEVIKLKKAIEALNQIYPDTYK